MTRRRGAVLLGLLLVAASAVFVALPPQPTTLAATATDEGAVRGAFHVHSRRSDGSGTPEQIAAAAARAGLRFVILTDHGDGTRAPMRPAYHSRVLVVDGVELSSEDGHVVAVGLPKTPYPLRGEARDIVDDIARMGGMSVAAHPGSTKPQLRWTEWGSPFDGLEWLNGDSESRDEPWTGVARTLFTLPFRPSPSLSTLLDRPDTILRRWDALSARRRVVALAAADAHARLDVSDDEAGGPLPMLRIPGYESMFRTFSVTATGVRLANHAEADSAAVIAAVRQGHVYSSIDALAAPASVSFRATRGESTWVAGDFVPPGDGDIELHVESNAPPGSRIELLRNGTVIETSTGQTLRRAVAGTPAVYRIEIQLAGAPGVPPVPWVVTNPIYVRAADTSAVPRGDARESTPLYENGDAPGWRMEKSPRSQAALDVVRMEAGTELLMRWALGGTLSESPFAALVTNAGPSLSNYDRLLFTVRADRPTRLSVQFRSTNGDRWRRSVYIDEMSRALTVFFDDVRPAGVTAQRRLPLKDVRDVLFVVDTVNAKPGAAGQVWIDDVKYGR